MTVARYVRQFGAVLLTATLAGSAGAQSASADSARVRAVTQIVISALAGELADVALNPTARPWRFSVSAADSSIWIGVRERLAEMLHARPPFGPDSAERFITIRETRHDEDARTYSVRIGSRWPCPKHRDRSIEGYMALTIVAELRDGVWGAVSEPHPMMSDPAPCPP